MATPLIDTRVTPRFAGETTFGRYPRLDDARRAHADGRADETDWIVFGVPHDGGVTYRPGARFGPRAIREASQYLKRVHAGHGVDVGAVLTLADGGDAPVRPYHPKDCLDGVAAWAADLEPRDARLLALGGDHSIAWASLAATHRRLGARDRLALLHFDAHVDTVDSVWGERWGHASPFIRAIEDGLIDPARTLSVGIRGPLNTRADVDGARDLGITVLTADDARRELAPDGTAATIRRFIASLGGAPVYVTFDIDCVDPAYAPGTGTPCPGGFTSAEAFALLRSASGANVVGGDVVEVLPMLDHAEITALLAAHVAFEILALAAIRRVGPGSVGPGSVGPGSVGSGQVAG